MSLNFLERLGDALQKTIQENSEKINLINAKKQGINQEEAELAEKLKAIQEFSIDRFEGNIAVLENRNNGEIINIEKNKLPNKCNEGDIVKCINGKYFLDEEKTLEEENRIKNTYKDLWK